MFRQSLKSFDRIPNLHQKVNAISDIVNNRPPPLRQYDQIYMKLGDMVLQAELVQELVQGKEVVFMGDGDGMALVFAYLSALNLLEGPKRSVVLDFDERIVLSIQKFATEHNLDGLIEAYLYNVKDPVPAELMGKFDFFYTNPPYGSANNGQSAIVFIDRCLESCLPGCAGCLIAPYSKERAWTRKAMFQIQAYAIQVGLVVCEMLRDLHGYHLDDDPALLSSTIVLERVHHHPTVFRNDYIPQEKLKNFYGRDSLDIPRYIRAKPYGCEEGSSAE